MQGHTVLKVSSLFKDGTDSLLLFDPTSLTPLPVSLRLGDMDLDGFPDIVSIVVHKNGAATPHLLLSTPCGSGPAGCGSSIGRSFKVLSRNTEVLEDITDARGVALLDIDEDVHLHSLFNRHRTYS